MTKQWQCDDESSKPLQNARESSEEKLINVTKLVQAILHF